MCKIVMTPQLQIQTWCLLKKTTLTTDYCGILKIEIINMYLSKLRTTLKFKMCLSFQLTFWWESSFADSKWQMLYNCLFQEHYFDVLQIMKFFYTKFNYWTLTKLGEYI